MRPTAGAVLIVVLALVAGLASAGAPTLVSNVTLVGGADGEFNARHVTATVLGVLNRTYSGSAISTEVRGGLSGKRKKKKRKENKTSLK